MVTIEKILVTDKFEKDVKKIRDKGITKRIGNEVKKIISNPNIGKPLSYDLSGERTIRIKPYRLIYTVKGNSLILLRFEHRSNVYED